LKIYHSIHLVLHTTVSGTECYNVVSGPHLHIR